MWSRVQALETAYDRNARALSTTFTLVNQCNYKVWPGILSGAGIAQLAPTGFLLNPGQSVSFPVPTGWSGRLWGRTFCSQDSSTGKFACGTGDCSSGTLECSGTGAAPPVTVAEFTLNGAGGLDFYDVSLVDGYNLPILVSPQGGTGVGGVGNCSTTGCVGDLNEACPKELKKMMDSHSSKTVVTVNVCDVRARVKRLMIRDTVVVDHTRRLIRVSQRITQSSSRMHVQNLIAMLMMMAPVPSLVVLQIMLSPFVLLLMIGM
ncbi:Thaumatin-like protein 1 [Capsicum baccatum]|uniref:Thaumatin-like protein 1 n=1 Tax=Capsicum baccatum TaxID=33114 RepID=A0A2G2WXK9_CAPBA|nr:Thaumatin-like protein 1 [Capsicum baccatum]